MQRAVAAAVEARRLEASAAAAEEEAAEAAEVAGGVEGEEDEEDWPDLPYAQDQGGDQSGAVGSSGTSNAGAAATAGEAKADAPVAYPALGQLSSLEKVASYYCLPTTYSSPLTTGYPIYCHSLPTASCLPPTCN
jgi:hypothetical protein